MTSLANSLISFAEHGKLVAESSEFQTQNKRDILSEKRDGAEKA